MNPTESPLVTLTNFRKQFGTKVILDIPKLSIPTGINRLIGKNGAGKTTLLRIIAGQSSFKGELLLFGELNIRKSPTKHRQWVNFSESEPVYPDKARGIDMVTIFSRAHRATGTKTPEIIERFQMTDYLSTPIGTYSAGMKKKLSLLLAFIGSPKLILLDEPFITIDQAARQELRELIAEFHSHGCSFILSTHGDLDHPVLARHPVFEVTDQGIQRLTLSANSSDPVTLSEQTTSFNQPTQSDS